MRISTQVWRRPEHRLLGAAETTELLRSYQRAHPQVWKRLAPMLGVPPDPQITDLGAVHALVFTPSSPADHS